MKIHFPKSVKRGLLAVGLAVTTLPGLMAAPGVTFASPTNNQTIVSFTGLTGTASSATGMVQSVVFSLYDQTLGQYWNGTNYQASFAWLATSLAGTNWTPAGSVSLPAVCCGQIYQLSASATNNATNVAITNISVQADSTAPVVAFTTLVNGQVVADLSAVGGSVTDNFGLVASVQFSVRELDINGGPGRWWNGTNFQNSSRFLPATVAGSAWAPTAGVRLPALNSGQGYELTVTAMDTTSNSTSASITVSNTLATLTWDPGTTPLGTQVFSNPTTNGGCYWFKINTQNPSVGAWRTALNVLAGEANVYLSYGAPPWNTNSYSYGSARVGSDGFVLDASQFSPSQDWYLLVFATPNAQWNLVTGDTFVYDLGALSAGTASSTNAPIGAESMIFFKTTIAADTLAWRVWLNGAPNTVYVKKAFVPHPASYELTQNGQMLVVPPYLAGGTFNGTYFIGVPGAPGTAINLDSRKHAVVDLPFTSLTNVAVAANDFPYRTFRVQVPVQQIAWQLNLSPTSGIPNLAVRRDLVPNEFRNDAFSETPAGVGASVTLVPPPPEAGTGAPGLSDGTFYVTVYGTNAFGCAFTNGNPVITDVHYLFGITNDVPVRAGWRFYRVQTIAEQLGTLGWELLLSNQVAGTEIALRRNAVPGHWNQRQNDNNYYFNTQGYVDYSGTGGFLQRPGHQADIWYIGVYTPAQALGSFVLTGKELTGQPAAFDGVGSSVMVTNEVPGKWRFFRVDVPNDALGWDVRLVDVTNGSPQMVVSRDTLPTSLSTSSGWPYSYWYPNQSTNWLSSLQWLVGVAWNGCGGSPMLASGIGNPLRTGTYYVGVLDQYNTNSYTLQSRGIGLTNYTIRVRDLAFNGSVTNNSLATREGDYYRVTVAGNTPDWKLKLKALSGDLVLKVQRDFLPNSGYGGYSWPYGYVQSGWGGQLMMKTGDEEWVLLPENGQSNVTAGTYYVLVGSQGQNVTNLCGGSGNGLGGGNAGYSLTSGVESVIPLPDTLSYAHDLVITNTQQGGEMRFYTFNVPTNIASLEVKLENRVGNPVMYLSPGKVPAGSASAAYYSSSDAYGNYGGSNWLWQGSTFITLANPNGAYALSVQASSVSSEYPDAGYVVRVRAVPPTQVAFDGGTAAVTNQPAGQWHFFQVNVPTNALGWDVRIVDLTNGNPQMVVCRDVLPTTLYTSSGWPYSYWYPNQSTNWLSGLQWLAGVAWNACGGSPMLAVGMDNPLVAGTYYIGIFDANNTNSYTLQSRGIGLTNYTLRVRDLSFNGSVTNNSLAAREGDYYRVTVAGNTPDWKLKLKVLAGDLVLKVQRDFLPNSGYGGYSWPYGYVQSGWGGQLMMKTGNEEWVLLPENGQSNVTAGTYYVLVGSQGQNLTNLCGGSGNGLGGGNAGYTLSSGVEPVVTLPDSLSYSNDLVLTNTQAGGEMRFYQFNVPTNIASIEVKLENRVGNPVMYLSPGTVPAGSASAAYYYSSDAYGNYGGSNWFWQAASLITLPNPSGPYSVSVHASTVSGEYPDAGYVLRVHAMPPTLVAFDGGTAAVANQPPGQWQFFQVNVPTNALGWDVRLVGVTNGNPQMVVSRDTLPNALSTSPGWPYSYWYPNQSTNWLSGLQWQAGLAWNGCGGSPMVAVGMDNPLVPGTYYIGILDQNNTNSYTVQSRGIGSTNYTIRVRDLAFNGSVTNSNLAVREGDYYRVTVAGNTPDWKLKLKAFTGDTVLKVQRDFLPNSGYGGYSWPYGCMQSGMGGQLMMKAGDEEWVLLPENGQSNVTAGTYYVLVGSQGDNLTNHCNGAGSGLGAGDASYTLTSGVEPATTLPGTLSFTNDLVFTNAQQGGEMRFYRFTVPTNVPSLEVRLENRIGNPVLNLSRGNELVGTYAAAYGYSSNPYGNYGGTNWLWQDPNLITIPNPQAGEYSLSIYASSVSDTYPEVTAVLRVRIPTLDGFNICSDLNTNGQTNGISGVLADNQRAFYQVIVPASINGAPVLGWKLDLNATNGTPSVRVRQNLLPDDNYYAGTSPFNTPTATIVPPYLTPGTWYVEIKGGGATTYSLTSSVITTNTLKHPLWVMPALGQTNTAPGLDLPMIGDSGVDAGGTPLSGDQGIDLKQGEFDYYAVLVPSNNGSLLRTVVQAISGNPNIYLRMGVAPTLAHYSSGTTGDALYERSLTGTTTEYGSWVPLDGRYETQLAPGIWVMAVQAAGNSNVRYRLQLSCGNPRTNGMVQNLDLMGGTFTNQNLSGGDWRYYRVQIPDPAPANWNITWWRSLGSVTMFVRDTLPPGDGYGTAPGSYANPDYNPAVGYPISVYHPSLQTWNTDGKNQGLYPRFDAPGSYNLSTPPLRPGHVYYLGFWSPNDATFALGSSTNGGPVIITNTIPYAAGMITNVLPGYGCLRYRMVVPPEATRIMFSANNSANVVFSLEQGTIAQPGGPAHWTSYNPPSGTQNNQANCSLNQVLGTNTWPWLPGYTYYLTVTNTAASPENFSLSMATSSDLAPVALLAPTSLNTNKPNPYIQVIWGVTNQGQAAATNVWGGWYDRVWFSTNGVLDANSVPIGYFWIYQPLAVGDSYWQTNTVMLPMTASGNYTLFVETDYNNYLFESNKANNISLPVSGVLTLVPADLALLAAMAPAVVNTTQAYPTIRVVWGGTNRGPAAATGGWYDRVWFSTNGVLDGQSQYAGEFYISQNVLAGETYWLTNTITLPMTNGGNFTLFVQADVYNYVYESTKTNNVSLPLAGIVVFGTAPQITNQPASQTVALGNPLNLSVGVTGTPTLAYQWFFNGTNVVPSATTASLTVTNIGLNNAGLFSVVVTNAFGAATSQPALIQVSFSLASPVLNLGDGSLTLQLQAEPQRAYWLEAKSNLTDVLWVFVTGMTNTNGLVQFPVQNITNDHRYYRIGTSPVP